MRGGPADDRTEINLRQDFLDPCDAPHSWPTARRDRMVASTTHRTDAVAGDAYGRLEPGAPARLSERAFRTDTWMPPYVSPPAMAGYLP
jgi:hypothetical protein